MNMKYYVYVSDTKVDMLYSQISQSILRKIAAELNINLGIFSLSVKEKENQEKTRYEKLKLVVNYIENKMNVGTVDQPWEYFKGSLPMRWEQFKGRLVYFTGRTSQTVIGLGGSAEHMTGYLRAKENEKGAGTSFAWSIIDVLDEELNVSNADKSSDRSGRMLYSVYKSEDLMSSPLQQLEFLAKRFVEGTFESKHVVLGSPLYVAMTD